MTDFGIDLNDLPEIIGASDELKARVTQRVGDLIDATFDQAEELLETGDPATRQAILKMILPLAIKVKEKTEAQGVDVERMKADVRDLLAEMGAGLGPRPVVRDPDEDDDDDTD